jgi:hypothetical protein
MRTSWQLLALVFCAAIGAGGCASSGQPSTAEAMGQRAQPRAVECDLTATRVRPRECTQNMNARAIGKDEMLENERRAQQVQIPLVPGGR